MNFLKSLSKREKILIYVLSLLLLLYIYLNFLRPKILIDSNAKASDYVSQEAYQAVKDKYNVEKSKFEDFASSLEKIEDESNNFGKNLDLEKLSTEDAYNISSFNISNVMIDTKDDLRYFYIDKDIVIEDKLEKINSFISFVKENDKLFLEDLSFSRLNEEDFKVSVKIREYTLKEVPYTGISYSQNNKNENTVENEEQSLLSMLYGQENHKEANNVESTQSFSSSRNYNKSKGENIKGKNLVEEKEIQEEISLEEESQEIIEDINPYDFVDTRNIDYNKEWNFEKESYYFSAEFITKFYQDLEDISNVNDLASNSENNEILEFPFENRLVLSDFELKIEESENGLVFELNGPKYSKGLLYLLDSSRSLYTIEIMKNENGNELINIALDKNYDYPLTLQSLIMDDELEKMTFKNLVTYE